jgi:hypothetical protein
MMHGPGLSTLFAQPNQPITKGSIQEFFYLASIKNLESILTSGILSHKRANRVVKNHTDISNDEVQGRRAGKYLQRVDPKNTRTLSLHQHAPLFLNPQNAMIKTCKEPDVTKLCLLRIYPELLHRGDVVLSSQNAATDNATFFTADAFQLSPRSSTILNHRDSLYDGKFTQATDEAKKKYVQVRQAEALAPYEIAPSYIGGILVPCEQTRTAVQAILQKLQKTHIVIDINASVFHRGPNLESPAVVHLQSFKTLKELKPLPANFAQVYPESSDSEDSESEHEAIPLKRKPAQ